jgi:hypothetical protein
LSRERGANLPLPVFLRLGHEIAAARLQLHAFPVQIHFQGMKAPLVGKGAMQPGRMIGA